MAVRRQKMKSPILMRVRLPYADRALIISPGPPTVSVATKQPRHVDKRQQPGPIGPIMRIRPARQNSGTGLSPCNSREVLCAGLTPGRYTLKNQIESMFSLEDVRRVLYRHRRKSVTFFCATLIIVLATLVVWPREYRSEGKLFVKLGR